MKDYVVIDLEMTGLSVKTNHILEVGAVRIRENQPTETFSAILRQNRNIPESVVQLTGITMEMVRSGREKEEAMAEFFSFIGEDILVGQNVMFDYNFLKQWAVNHDMPFARSAVDTLKLARKFLPKEQKKDLASLCAYFGIERKNAHRAFDDAYETWQVFEALQTQYGQGHEEDFAPKQLCSQIKKQRPATARQKSYLRQYAAYYQIPLPEHFEELTRSEASRLADNWIVKYGRIPKKQ